MKLSKSALSTYLIGYNTLLSFVSVIGIIFGILILTVSALSYVLPVDISIWIIVLFSFLLAVSLMGASGTLQRRPSILWIYNAFTVATVVVLIIAAILITSKRSDLQTTASNVWSGFQPSSRVAIQAWGKCCGFLSNSDRPESSCNLITPPLPGCWDSMSSWFSKSILVLIIFVSVLAVLQSVSFILAVAFISQIPKSFSLARARGASPATLAQERPFSTVSQFENFDPSEAGSPVGTVGKVLV